MAENIATCKITKKSLRTDSQVYKFVLNDLHGRLFFNLECIYRFSSKQSPKKKKMEITDYNANDTKMKRESC